MNATEKVVLQQLMESLEESTNSGFSSGNVDDFHRFANQMRETIKTSVNVMRGLLTLPTEPKENSGYGGTTG